MYEKNLLILLAFVSLNDLSECSKYCFTNIILKTNKINGLLRVSVVLLMSMNGCDIECYVTEY